MSHPDPRHDPENVREEDDDHRGITAVKRARNRKRRLLERIAENPGLTAREVFGLTGKFQNKPVTGNLHDLEREGDIIWGEDARRETLDGGKVKGWHITDQGLWAISACWSDRQEWEAIQYAQALERKWKRGRMKEVGMDAQQAAEREVQRGE